MSSFAVVLLLFPLPAVAPAQLTYSTNVDRTLTITGYNGPGGDVTVPSTIEGLAVRAIGARGFSGSAITSLNLAAGIREIDDHAFDGCVALTACTLPQSLQTIQGDAFRNCSSLTTITLPAGVTQIGGVAFYGCTSLTEIDVDPSNSMFSSDGGVLFNKSRTLLIEYPQGKPGDYTIADGVTRVGNGAFTACVGLSGVVMSPSVTDLGTDAFSACANLTSVTLSTNIQRIPARAFLACGLMGLTLPDNIVEIDDSAFGACYSLANVNLGNGRVTIGDAAFSLCPNLETVTMGDNVKSIGNGSFSGCESLTSINLSRSLTRISVNAFGNDYQLSNVQIPASVTDIGANAFWSCGSLSTITIPANVTNIGTGAFLNCYGLSAITVDPLNPVYASADGVLFSKDLSELIAYPADKPGDYSVPRTVRTLSDFAFGYAIGLTAVELPPTVASIGQFAFEYCTALSTITLPNTVTNVEASAFANCTQLAGVYFEGNAPTAGPGIFDGDNSVIVYRFAGASGWTDLFEGIQVLIWNPPAQATISGVGFRENQFGFTISGSSGLIVVVEATTVLNGFSWTPIGTNALTSGSAYFSDSGWSNFSGRFYRLRWQ